MSIPPWLCQWPWKAVLPSPQTSEKYGVESETLATRDMPSGTSRASSRSTRGRVAGARVRRDEPFGHENHLRSSSMAFPAKYRPYMKIATFCSLKEENQGCHA